MKTMLQEMQLISLHSVVEMEVPHSMAALSATDGLDMAFMVDSLMHVDKMLDTVMLEFQMKTFI